jgi:chemotaxis protein methyltransferase CheR
VLDGTSALVDYTLGEREFTRIAGMVRDASGIVLGPGKRDLVLGRLRRRLRALGLDGFPTYLDLLDGPDGPAERVRMINAITTNLTAFFREPHHFEHLAHTLIPALPRGSRRLRIWSAGCSSGEEPYTLALTLLEHLPDLAQRDARILATDIDTDMVATGRAGRYPAERLSTIPAPLRQRFARTLPDGRMEMAPEARALIAFLPLNLLEDWPMRGVFDAIFCRNVMIYFDKATQRSLFERFAAQLVPGGHLYVGHSEALHRTTDRFEHLGQTIYRKRA